MVTTAITARMFRQNDRAAFVENVLELTLPEGWATNSPWRQQQVITTACTT